MINESNQTPAQAICHKQAGDQVTPFSPAFPVHHVLNSFECCQIFYSSDANEKMVLEHYRIAVFELTRQNILLKRQLAAAEARLAQEESTMKCAPTLSSPTISYYPLQRTHRHNLTNNLAPF
jgi:hypothetical protein